MDSLSERILARDGEKFLKKWEWSLQAKREALEDSGLEIIGKLGNGGRGVVFLVGSGKTQMAAKIFVYQEECSPQAAALSYWKGFAPQVLGRFSNRTLLLEALFEERDISYKQDFETGMGLLNKMSQSSPKRKSGATSAYEHFAFRIKRAEERNKKHGVYKPGLIAFIENIFSEYKEGKKQVIHGDFSPGNILCCDEAKVIDPRGLLWGEAAIDASKWLLSRKKGEDIEEGLSFFLSFFLP